MRVLHVNAGNLFGGVETYLVTLARLRHLCPEMDPVFGLCFPGRLRDELTATGVEVHDLGSVRLRRPWTILRARDRLRHMLADQGYAVVVFHQTWALGLFGGVATPLRVPVVGHMHGPSSGGWVDWLGSRQRPRVVITPSEHTASTWRTAFPRAAFRTLNYPLPANLLATPDLAPADRDRVRTELGATPQDVVILQASRIERWKGPDLVIQALAGLRDLPGWRFWLAGGAQRRSEKAYYDALVRLAAEVKIVDRISFLGQRSDVPTLLRAADVYCQGNRGPEGFSLSFLEASYCRVPIVTTALGGAGEMIDPSTGVLVPAGEDPAPLSRALRDLITDPARRAGLGDAARTKAIRLCETGQQLRRMRSYLREAIELENS